MNIYPIPHDWFRDFLWDKSCVCEVDNDIEFWILAHKKVRINHDIKSLNEITIDHVLNTLEIPKSDFLRSWEEYRPS